MCYSHHVPNAGVHVSLVQFCVSHAEAGAGPGWVQWQHAPCPFFGGQLGHGHDFGAAAQEIFQLYVGAAPGLVGVYGNSSNLQPTGNLDVYIGSIYPFHVPDPVPVPGGPCVPPIFTQISSGPPDGIGFTALDLFGYADIDHQTHPNHMRRGPVRVKVNAG